MAHLRERLANCDAPDRKTEGIRRSSRGGQEVAHLPLTSHPYSDPFEALLELPQSIVTIKALESVNVSNLLDDVTKMSQASIVKGAR